MILLGVDLGQRRVGFATCDESWLVAVTLKTEHIRNTQQALDAVIQTFNEIGASEVILGHPRDMSGKRGAKAKESEDFAQKLIDSGIPTTLWDERLTTAEAERVMKDAKVSRKKRMQSIDALAAQRILDSYIQANKHLNL